MANRKKTTKITPLHATPKIETEPVTADTPMPLDVSGEQTQQMIEMLHSQLQDAHLVIGQKEMQIQRQAAMLTQAQNELQKRQSN